MSSDNRLKRRFSQLENENRGALITFITA
ncbi:uncharacterized protein METZ01_LOCUS222660, partial [marine metagenome]